jgi:NADP-dependent 3-hydroxy acid dehydrogenase YdfG
VTRIGTAVVTGATRGIGLEVSRLLVAGGARVIMMARSESDLRASARDLGPLAHPIACDVANSDAVARAAADACDTLGDAPDAIVNNAGAFTLAPVESTRADDFRAAVEVNLVAPFLVVRAFLPELRRRASGHIVTIGSIADRAIYPENGAYAASKFGARALTEVLRAELRGTGVRVTLVSPGPTDTPLWDEIDPDARPGFTPRRDMLRASAVADAVHYVLTRDVDVNVDELRLSHS